jgi:hypothetical protein
MIARPLNRIQPIPFGATPALSSAHTRTVSWAESAGPAAQAGGARRGFEALRPGTAPQQMAQILPRRSPVMASGHGANVPPGSPTLVTPAPRPHELSAKFLGHGALSVRSSATGRHYRFQGHGDIQMVDARDQLMLGRINDLLLG